MYRLFSSARQNLRMDILQRACGRSWTSGRSHKNESPPSFKAATVFITGRNEVLAKVIFSQACVKISVHRGGCLFLGGYLQIFGGGVPFLCVGVASKFSGGYLQIFGGVPPNFQGGVSSPGIRSMFGRYVSYWNAFLFF